MNASAWFFAVLSPATADVVYAGLTVAFFGLAIVFARFCEKIR